MSNDLIIVKQLPVIEEQLQKVKEDIEARVAFSLSLVCNEDTYKEVKRERAALAKEFRALEDKRKEVKQAIMEPYFKFEEVYKACAGDIYTAADAQLKEKIDDVEDGIKAEKRTEIQEYFSEYLKSKNIDFVTFDDAKINVTMSASKKSLKEEAAAFIDKVAEDLELIGTQEYEDEILVEYKKSLNAVQAITNVAARKEAIENEKQRRAAMEQEQAARAEAQKKVEDVIEEEVLKTPEPLAVPAETMEETGSDGKVFETSFRVFGTIEQLKTLKEFLEEGGYKYEQL